MPFKDRAKANEAARKYRLANREKCREAVKSWNKRNPERVAYHWRRSGLKRYGMTPETFAALSEEQGGLCAACREPFAKTPHVDHCHATGRVRALLCLPCNTALGLMRDDPERLRKLAEYIAAEGMHA